MTFNNLLKARVLLVPAVVFSLVGRVETAMSQIGGITLESTEGSERYHSFINLLQNGDFEVDDDVDGFPDGWMPWQWLVEEQLDLRKAILEYLGTSPGAVIRPRITTRFPFFGKRALDLVNIDGKTGPGIYVTREFSPGIYTLSLYAKNPGEGRRKLGVFLAAGGRLYEVGQRWRNIVYSEKLSYYIKGGEISLRDWTFLPGELLVDRVVLWKLPFDMRYSRRVDLTGTGDRFVVEFSDMDEILVPIGINLEIKAPTGKVVRKNIEGTLEQPTDEVVFELDLQAEGEYRLKLEIYDLRTADIIFTDDGIEAFYEPGDSIPTGAEGDGDTASLGFFPVGIRARGYELGSLWGKYFNSVLITEPAVDAMDLYRNQLSGSNMRVFFEVTHEMMSRGCNEEFHRLIELSRTIDGFSGWFVNHPVLENRLFSENQMEVWRCLDEEAKGLPIVVENCLPMGNVPRDSISFEYIAVDPNPISEPSRPVFTMGLWADQLAEEAGSTRTIGMPQVFGGWPIAHRIPTYGEIRAMTYLAVIHGARGIIFREFSSLRPFFDQTDASWDIRKAPELWERLPALNRELITLSPYFLEARVEREGITLDRDGFIDCGLWRESGNLLLVAVNVYDGDVDVTFRLDGEVKGDEIDVLFEERSIKIDASGFSDNFGPLETHVYRMTSEGD